MPFKKGGGHSKGRKSTRISLTVTRTPTPTQIQYEDETMGDADEDPTRDVTPAAQEDDGEEEEEEAATPAAEEDEEEEEEEEDDEPQITSLPRRRVRGGVRSSRSARVAATPEAGMDEGSESGTPARRRRGRPPGTGGGRGRGGPKRGRGKKDDGPSVVIDKEGNRLEVVDDEAIVDFDEEGAEKVDAVGNLQGGREYRVRTFTILGKGERLYMLSTEPARCCGFRDSYLFFTKHPKLFKVLLDEEQKKDLIDREVLPNSYKGRNIGVVTARSVFREFGAKIIVGGRRIIDDYKVTQALENGEVEGELVDPDDYVPEDRSQYNRNRYVAWFGASEVYRSQGGGATVPGGKQGNLGRKRNNVTVQNWQILHAREASRFNSTLTAMRKANLDGVYETNTNMMHYPKIMQPTHAKWEYIPPDDGEDKRNLTNGLGNGHHSLSDSDHDTVMEISPSKDTSKPTIFFKVPPVISRNFTVVDTVYHAPPISNAGYPGPDGHVEDPTSGPNGLSTVSQDLIDELPPDCRAAFEEARGSEVRWKQQWGTETHSAQRGVLKIGFNGYPV